ncbi:MAG: helix-turn-helix domain-containing protein [Anaerovoracaceae bacterium]
MRDERATEIGLRIQQVRKGLGLNQNQFAEKMSLSQNQISRLETGESMVTTEFVLKLNDIYNVDPGFLLLGKSARGLDYKMEKFIEWYESLNNHQLRSGVSKFCEDIMDILKESRK